MKTTASEKAKTFCVLGILSAFTFGFLGYVIQTNEGNKVEQAVNNGMYFSFCDDGVETIEYGDTIQAEELVKDYKGDLKVPKLNTKKLGKQTLVYSLTFGDYTKDFEKEVFVQDTKCPTIKALKGNKFQVQKGDKMPYSKNDFECVDPVDGKLPVSFTGHVDLNTEGVYVVQAHSADKNKNRVEETITLQVVAPKKEDTLSYMLGETLDGYTKIDDQTIEVRGHRIHIDSDVSQEGMENIIHQINLCPSFLLNAVDTFEILNSSNFSKYSLNKSSDTVKTLGHYMMDEKKNKVFLLDQKEDDAVVLHECVHAFANKHKVLKNKDFRAIFEKEKNALHSEASKNISEFFAYTFTKYIVDGHEALYESCPLTANYYKEMKL